MFEKIKGKKLLILGATASEISIIRRAKEMGVYTIVTDNCTELRKSPAKYEADEYWNISWSDIDALEKVSRERGISGVTAGYSEFRIENTIKLCERLRLPCYCTWEQLEITRNKIRFKEECRKYGIPVIKDYYCIDDVDEYPVIVKPTDRAGSIGISIATNRQELEMAYQYAMNLSVTKQVLIERYIEDGDKFDVYYAVENGQITELSTCDTIMAKKNGREKVIQSAWMYPSRIVSVFRTDADAQIRKMISGLGIRYGCIFFSGFYNNKEGFAFFECGFRLEGAHQYKYVAQKGLYDFNDIFISHALLGDTSIVERVRNYINEELKCIVINVYAKQGIISEIKGLEQVEALPHCELVLQRSYIGQECSDEAAILIKPIQFEICAEKPEDLKFDVEMAYRYLKILDQDGNDMIFDRIDTDQIIWWWG